MVTVTFDQLNALLLNKIIIYLKKLLNSSVNPVLSKTNQQIVLVRELIWHQSTMLMLLIS